MAFRVRRLDERNLVVEEWSTAINTHTGEPSPGHWRIEGYFGRYEDVASYLLNRQIEIPTGSLETQIPALLAEIKAAEARIVEELKSNVYA